MFPDILRTVASPILAAGSTRGLFYLVVRTFLRVGGASAIHVIIPRCVGVAQP